MIGSRMASMSALAGAAEPVAIAAAATNAASAPPTATPRRRTFELPAFLVFSVPSQSAVRRLIAIWTPRSAG